MRDDDEEQQHVQLVFFYFTALFVMGLQVDQVYRRSAD